MREFAILLCFPIQQALAHVIASSPTHREHKVHNIVLYPDKHSWCKTTPIKQVITHTGCKPVEIDNNVCVGACFSYSIPRTEPVTPGDVLPYCDSCQPSSVKWKHVLLECPDSEFEEDNVMTKKVQMISECACASCQHHKTSPHSHIDHQVKELEVPELMSLMLESHRVKEYPASAKNETVEYVTERLPISLKKTEITKENHYLKELQEIRTKIDQEENHNLDEEEMSKLIENYKSDKKEAESSKKLENRTESMHERHHMVPGPHHTMVYEYSPKIAEELYENSLKTKSEVTEKSSQDSNVGTGTDNSVNGKVSLSSETNTQEGKIASELIGDRIEDNIIVKNKEKFKIKFENPLEENTSS